MTRTLAVIALFFVTGGCVTALLPAPPKAPTGPVLAAWFDCVRDRGGVIISAHRAVSGDDQPENSIQAIEATGRLIPGAMVEFDTTLTRDGRLVLMHDQTLERTTTGVGRIAEMNFEQVRLARLKAKNGAIIDATPPTLAEALAATGRAGVIAAIDFKPVDQAAALTLAREVIDEIRAVGAAGRVVLITYSPEMARTLAALAPDMMISASLTGVDGLEGLNPAQILAWTSLSSTALRRDLAQLGVEGQVGTLGAPGSRLDDVYAADGDVSEYKALHAQGAVLIATDTPLAVKSVMGAELKKAQTCVR